MITYPLIGIGMTLILVAVMEGNLGLLSHVLKNKIFGYLGKISFGLYVYHRASLWLADQIASRLDIQDQLLMFPATVGLFGLIFTIVISMVSYQLLEKPFLRLKEKFTYIKSRPI